MANILLIVFDLDGVLLSSRDMHYESLNNALSTIDLKYIISKEEHLSRYDGLNTTKKLEMLTKEKGLPKEKHKLVWELKQKKTFDLIKGFKYDNEKILLLSQLKNRGYKIAVASNSIRETVKLMLFYKGFLPHIDFYYSNEDVKFPKPNVEMYLRCMIKAGVSPKETVIIEDSHIGRKSALDSGAYLFAVKNPEDVKLTQILNFIESINNKINNPKWQGGNMNIVIPMAGFGKRFEQANYSWPKPLIPIKNFNDSPMIKVVIDNLNIDGQYIFIVRKDHYEKYHLQSLLNVISPGCKIIQVDKVTEGAACTTLLAKDYIDNDSPLIIANSDQFIEWDSNEFMYSMIGDTIDGGILTFKNSHPKWSYVKLNDDGFVSEVKEKEVLTGNNATVGIYYWTKGSDYVKYANQMISKGDSTKVNGEWYVCPVYQQAINDNKRIKIFNINKMFGLGVPEDLEYFIQHYRS